MSLQEKESSFVRQVKCAITLPISPKEVSVTSTLIRKKTNISSVIVWKDFVVDYESFTKQTPAIVYTEAIKESTVYQLSYNQLEAFWAASQQNQLLGRKIAENLFCMTYQRLLNLYPNSPRVRYQELLRRCPDIVHQISLKEIASFLNISPYTLSASDGK